MTERRYCRLFLAALVIVCLLPLGFISCRAFAGQKKGEKQSVSRTPQPLPLHIADETDFFAALDLGRPGMETVKKADDARDWPAAKQALLAYMRNRKSPRFIVDRHEKGKYLTMSRREFPEVVKGLPSAADTICKHDFTFEGFHLRFKGEVVWDHTQSDATFAYGCWLSRMWYLETLGRAWWFTGNKKYSRCARDLVNSWIKSCPMPPEAKRSWPRNANPPSKMCVTGNPWGQSLEVAERLGSWTAFNEYFVDCDEITPEFYYRFLKSLLEQARYIYIIESHGYAPGNWPIVECGGLARVAIMFPEFKESQAWWEQLKKLFVLQMKKTVLPDGVQKERTIGYHNWCYAKFRDVLLLAQRNNVNMPEGFSETVDQMRLYAEKIAYPGRWGIPGLGDAGVRWWGNQTDQKAEEARDEVGRYGLLWQIGLDAYVQWAKRRGATPTYTSTELPHAGLFVMRTGWKAKDKFLLFDCVPPSSARSHWHNSALNVDVYAYGRSLIVDPGKGGYSHPGYTDYFRRVRAHNIVEFAGEENRNDPKLKRWLRSNIFDFAEGSVSAKWQAKMNRRVLFVKPDYWIIDDDVSVPHRHPTVSRAYWHLNSRSVVVGGKQAELASNGAGASRLRWMGGKGKDLSFHTNDPDIGNILVIPDGGEHYASLSLIADTPCGGHVACYRQDPNPPAKTKLRFTTLMYPFTGTNRPAVSFKDGVVKIGDDRVDTYMRKGEQTDGDCALISKQGGAVRRVLLVDGSNVKGVVRLDGKANFLIITRDDKKLDIQLIASVKIGRLELPGFDGIKHVTVNGKACPLSRKKSVLIVSGPFEKNNPDPTNTRLFWIIKSLNPVVRVAAESERKVCSVPWQ